MRLAGAAEAIALQGQGELGLAQLRQGLAAISTTGPMVSRPFGLVLLTEASAYVGQVREGLSLLAEALAAFEASGRQRMNCWRRSTAGFLKALILPISRRLRRC